MPSYATLLSGPFRAQDVMVRWNPAPQTFEPEAQAYLDARWEHYLADAKARGKTLFNGPVTRMIDFRHEGGKMILEVGPGDYKTFLVSTLRDRAWFRQHAAKSVVRAMGNCVLVTHQGRAAVGVRSHHVSAYAGWAHIFGGVLDRLGQGEITADHHGLINHLRLELHEEAGMTAEELPGEPTLLGLFCDPVLDQPELIWHWEAAVPLETLAPRIRLDEHERLVLLTRELSEPDRTLQFTPLSQAALAAWRNGQA